MVPPSSRWHEAILLVTLVAQPDVNVALCLKDAKLLGRDRQLREKEEKPRGVGGITRSSADF